MSNDSLQIPYEYRSKAIKIIIEDGVTTVGDASFLSCRAVKNVVLPNSLVSIGRQAFDDCNSLTDIQIPTSVTSIGASAFRHCSGLTHVEIPSSVTKLGGYEFADCSSLTSAVIQSAQLSGGMFYDCTNLTSVTISASVLDVDENGSNPFNSCNNLQQIIVDGQNPNLFVQDGVLFKRNAEDRNTTTLICYPGTKSGAYTIPSHVKELQLCAFSDCKKLTSVKIPSSLYQDDRKSTELGSSTFEGCTSLKRVEFDVSGWGDGTGAMVSVGGDTFKDCTSLTSIVIPHGFTQTGVGCFSGCTNLTSVAIPSPFRVIDDNTFEGCTSLTDIYFNGSKSDWDKIKILTKGNDVLQNVTIHYNSTGPSDTPWNKIQGILNNLGKKFTTLLSFRCPVDVEIYTADGQLAGNVIDSIADVKLGDSMYIEVSGDEKYVYLLDNDEYAVRFSGTDNGTMTYSVQNIQVDTWITTDHQTFAQVALTDGKQFVSTVRVEGGVAADVATKEVKLYVLGTDGEPSKEVLPDGKGTEVPVEIPPECDHSYTTSVTAPTCTERGYTTHTCSKCGDSYADTYTAALGHSYGEWRTVTAATAATSGLKERFCIRCNDRQTQSIPATGGNTMSGNDNNSSSGGPSYSIEIPTRVTGGTVKVTPTSASERQRVTVTVKANPGYKLDKLTVTDSKGNELKLTDKGDGKYTFTMPDSKVTVDVSFAAIAEVPTAIVFTDVPSGAYYYDAVAWAVKKGVTSGASATMFSPDSNCTRAQIVTFLWRAAGSPVMGGNSPFTDVASGSYYYDAVQWAVAQGITAGTSATTFSPEAACTRGQAVTFLYRAAGSPVAGGSSAFVDVSDDAYHTNAVRWAVSKGVTAGTSTTTFSPDSNCTRAQIVSFLYRDRAN